MPAAASGKTAEMTGEMATIVRMSGDGRHRGRARCWVIFAFGEFELDSDLVELRLGERLVTVQPKVFRLLLHLVAHRDRVVSTEELLSVLWPGETVTEWSIRRAITAAR